MRYRNTKACRRRGGAGLGTRFTCEEFPTSRSDHLYHWEEHGWRRV